MKRLTVLLLAVCLLCGCSGKPATTPTNPPATTAPTTAPTVPTTEPVTEPTEPVVLYRHPLTGMPLEAPFEGRITAVVINNIKECLPQYGISQADMYFELETESGITRCLALYSDISKVDRIEPVRSARSFFSSIAYGYDAPLIHCGGSEFALKGRYDDTNKLPQWEHLDERFNGQYFERDTDRYYYQSYAWEHTLFSTGELLAQALKDKGYDTVSQLDFGLQFADSVTLSGETANEIVFTFPGKKTTTMTYDTATGLYTMSQYGETTVDAGNGENMTFTNVICLYADYWKKNDSYYTRSIYDLVGEGDGYLAIGGQIVPIKWSREAVEDSFTYTLEDGTPVTLGVGTTYVGVSSHKAQEIQYS